MVYIPPLALVGPSKKATVATLAIVTPIDPYETVSQQQAPITPTIPLEKESKEGKEVYIIEVKRNSVRQKEVKKESPDTPKKKRMKTMAIGQGKRKKELMPSFPHKKMQGQVEPQKNTKRQPEIRQSGRKACQR